jgi:hypothetical protein
LEVYNITAHPVLELDGIFLVEEIGVLMIVIQVVVNLRRVKLTWVTNTLSSDSTTILLWNTS